MRYVNPLTNVYDAGNPERASGLKVPTIEELHHNTEVTLKVNGGDLVIRDYRGLRLRHAMMIAVVVLVLIT